MSAEAIPHLSQRPVMFGRIWNSQQALDQYRDAVLTVGALQNAIGRVGGDTDAERSLARAIEALEAHRDLSSVPEEQSLS